MELEPTGERLIEKHYQASLHNYLIWLIHKATYQYAGQWTKGAAVLDLGCGSGYGSHMLVQTAASVVGVDVDPQAVQFAKENYQHAGLSFGQIEADAALPFADASFDVVTSFQVIEHVKDVPHYLAEIRRVLKPGGLFLCATPNRETRLLKHQKPWNRYHLLEYDAASLKQALAESFLQVEIHYVSGTPELIRVELRRTRLMKWLFLPVTAREVPEAFRQFSLGAVKKFQRMLPRRGQAESTPDFPHSVDDIRIGSDPANAVDLIAVCRPHSR